MFSDAQRFATAVLEAFRHAGYATDAQVVAAGGPSTTTMTKLRKVAAGAADMVEPREPTWSKIDKAAVWRPGTARRIWAGEDPPRRAVYEITRERLDEFAASADEIGELDVGLLRTAGSGAVDFAESIVVLEVVATSLAKEIASKEKQLATVREEIEVRRRGLAEHQERFAARTGRPALRSDDKADDEQV